MYYDGTTTGTTVSSGGYESVYYSGTTTGTTVSDGGFEVISNNGTAVGATVISGGTMILSGGVADGTTLQAGGAIDLAELEFLSSGMATLDLSSDVLTISQGDFSTTLDLAGNYTGLGFQMTSDPEDGTDVTAEALCFLAGTSILTPAGEVQVQNLARGDQVITWGGATRTIVWVGVGRVLATRGQRGAATPVIVRRGALANEVPLRDLRLTKGHALLLHDVLIPVEFLINHRSILWDDRAQEVSLYHLELDRHDVLVADGAPAESYRDDGNRWLFQNPNAGWGPPRQTPCANVLTGGPMVDAVWSRLLARAGPRPNLPLTDDPGLRLLVGGQWVKAQYHHGTAHMFALSSARDGVRVVSRSAVPQELGVARDPRELGVALRRVVLRQDARFQIITASDERLTNGFHSFEPDTGLRWTDGDGVLPAELFHEFDGPLELVLDVGCTTRYPLLGEPVHKLIA